jgi:alkyl hydroperoxide reductase subunit AhpF
VIKLLNRERALNIELEAFQKDALYDAIIVGARCAGAPTAMLLARHGFKVCPAMTFQFGSVDDYLEVVTDVTGRAVWDQFFLSNTDDVHEHHRLELPPR